MMSRVRYPPERQGARMSRRSLTGRPAESRAGGQLSSNSLSLMVDVEAESPGDLVEEPGVGEEPLSPGALADRAAVVSGVQEAVEGYLGGCRRVSAGPVNPQQDGFFGKRGRPGLAAEPHDDVAAAAADNRYRQTIEPRLPVGPRTELAYLRLATMLAVPILRGAKSALYG
jgi:hypothetical protein